MDPLIAQAINPDTTITTFRALMLGIASLALIWVGVSSLLGPGRTGNSKGVANRLAASLLSLIPIAIGVAVGAAAFGAAFLDWAIPGLA